MITPGAGNLSQLIIYERLRRPTSEQPLACFSGHLTMWFELQLVIAHLINYYGATDHGSSIILGLQLARLVGLRIRN